MYVAEDQLIAESDFAVGVLGRGEDFILFPLGEALDETARMEAKERGLTWCGVLGIKDGVPKVQCDPHPESVQTMVFAAMEFARLVVGRIRPLDPPNGDTLEWLRAFHALPDLRA